MFKIGEQVYWLGQHTYPMYTILTITTQNPRSYRKDGELKTSYQIEDTKIWYTECCFISKFEKDFEDKLNTLVNE